MFNTDAQSEEGLSNSSEQRFNAQSTFASLGAEMPIPLCLRTVVAAVTQHRRTSQVAGTAYCILLYVLMKLQYIAEIARKRGGE